MLDCLNKLIRTLVNIAIIVSKNISFDFVVFNIPLQPPKLLPQAFNSLEEFRVFDATLSDWLPCNPVKLWELLIAGYKK